MAKGTRFSFHMRGLDVDNGDVRVDDFIRQLNSFKNALSVTDRLIAETPSIYFRIVDLRHQSPAFVELEAVPVSNAARNNAGRVVNRFFRSLDEIERGVAPEGFDFSTFQAFKEITMLLQKDRITELGICREDDSQAKTLTPLSSQIDKILGPDEYEVGSATGMLDQINIHANQNVFTIYPTSKQRKLRCVFAEELRPQAIKAVGQYVRVSGRMKYKSHLERRYPYEVLVRDLEVYPPESELPTLGSLEGAASDMPLSMPSEEFVRRIRDEW